MNIEVLEKTEHNLVFIIEGISIEMANAIRRIILTEIPVMAIDEVIILKNDSPLYDEILAHRLGLIPLKTDLDVYRFPSDCECGGSGCPLCQVSFTCEVTNNTNSPIIIYSGDLKSNDPKVVPVDPNIPIIKIDKEKQIIFEAYAILGRAKDHARWQAVSNVFYRYYPIVEINNNKCNNCSDKCIAARMCPKKIINFDEKIGIAQLIDDYWKVCNLCRSCEDNCPENAIKTSWKENTYIFSIESDGVLPFDVLIKKTFEIFLEKIDEFTSKLEEIKI
ncbi:MAG: DNA-directed RNA polymerase subunit D [Promethearchaeota archaeon]